MAASQVAPPSRHDKPCYRPTPLRWYYIVCLILFILTLMGLVTWAELGLPDSDGTAKIITKASPQEHPTSKNAELQVRQQNQDEPRLSTKTITKDYSTIVTRPGTTGRFTTIIPKTEYKTSWLLTTSTEEAKTFVTIVPTVFSTQIPTLIAETSIPGDLTEVYTEVETITVGGNGTGSVYTTTLLVTQTIPAEFEPTTYTSYNEEIRTRTSLFTTVEDGVTKTFSNLVTETFTNEVTSEGETTEAPSTYVEYGKITLTQVYTIQGPSNGEDDDLEDDSDDVLKYNYKDGSEGGSEDDSKDRSKDKSGDKSRDKSEDNPEDKSEDESTDETTDETKDDPDKQDGETAEHNHDGTSDSRPTARPSEKVINVVSTRPDQTVKKVEKIDPFTYVTKDKSHDVETVVISQAPSTIVSQVGAVGGSVDAVSTVVSRVGDVEDSVNSVSTDWEGLMPTNRAISTKSASFVTFVKPAGLTTFVTTKTYERLNTVTSSRTGSSTFLSTIKGTTKTFAKTTTVTPTITGESGSKETGAGDEEDNNNSTIVKTVIRVYQLDPGKYFLGKFLPAMLAVLLSIAARVINYNAQLYQPFYSMNQPNGATGSQSMTLHFSGFAGFLQPFKVLAEGHPVPFITMLVVGCAALLGPTAVEAIGFKMHGECSINAFHGCAPAIGVSPSSNHALLAIMALLVVLLCSLLFFLRDWDTGLYANPWSVAGIASLASNRQIRPQKGSEKDIEKEMAEKRYGFGLFENRTGEMEYGIVLHDNTSETQQQNQFEFDSSSTDSSTPIGVKKGRRNPFIVLGLAWRLSFLLFLLGLITLLLYYHLTLDKQSDFKNFINSQTFGVRFLFSAFGVFISFTWTAFFISIAMIVPYQVMSQGPQPASNSVLLTRSTNPISGFWSAVKHGQPFPVIVAIMTILSEFMPILLANIPYSLSQVRIAHDICLRLAVSILAAMALTIIISFVIRWPDMPVDPRSIAGAMYYVSESTMVDHFSGMVKLNNKKRKQRIKEMGGAYFYGELTTRTGEKRPAVEWDDRTLGVIPPIPQHIRNSTHARHDDIYS
ncbi:hypothetical protein FALBO_11432 [Fusarium albosuccineum]|uniref:Zonadhesin n=1 Tax=Fusarium albosuccineum TaxID=1237068 RepID=A0A8H4PA37_9HYPO|nr:hypothetical protein FALBO_11432 [Fusarium albosuccineum]